MRLAERDGCRFFRKYGKRDAIGLFSHIAYGFFSLYLQVIDLSVGRTKARPDTNLIILQNQII